MTKITDRNSFDGFSDEETEYNLGCCNRKVGVNK